MERSLYMQRYEEEDFLYTEYILNNGFKYQKNANWLSASPPLKKLQQLEKTETLFYLVTSLDTHKTLFLNKFKGEDILNVITINRVGSVSVSVSSKEGPDILIDYIQFLENKLTKQSAASKEDISVTFWNLTSQGPKSTTRKIAAPLWKDIQLNYCPETRTGLNSLMTKFRPESGGQLVLLHGNPGAGKTYSLRALCQAWRSWCNVHYILDPEQLFGSSSYFSSLILDQEEPEYEVSDDDEVKKDKKWRLLILEDTGELLSEDARTRTGQGLSRLLNLADGFIGQGLRVLILITTNEELGKLHPAVSREGRCAAAIEFNDFSRYEALDWANAHKIELPDPVKSKYSLADLYAVYKDQHAIRVDLDEEKTPLGFRVPASA